MRLTAAGKILYDKAVLMEEAANDIESSLLAFDSRLSGTVRVFATEGVGYLWLVPVLADFCRILQPGGHLALLVPALPGLAAPARVDGHDTLSESPVLREEGSVQEVHLLDGVHGDGLSEFASGWIGDVALIHD